MEDSNSNEAKQANVAVSSLNYFSVKYYLPKMPLMRRWFQNVVSLILTCLCILKCLINDETIPKIESSKGSS